MDGINNIINRLPISWDNDSDVFSWHSNSFDNDELRKSQAYNGQLPQQLQTDIKNMLINFAQKNVDENTTVTNISNCIQRYINTLDQFANHNY